MSATQAVKDRFADYVPVSERLEQFYSDHPEGRILTAIIEHDAENGFVLIRAEVYRAQDDALPAATGHAFENRSEGFVNKTSYIENCETSATGRALALLGYEIKRGIASKEEMQKTERMSVNGPNKVEVVCPECGQFSSVIKGKAEYGGGYLCFKKKGGCGAKWASEGITEGYGADAALRDQLFSQAEKMMSGMSVERRKDALGRLVLLSTEDMSKKVAELSEKARQKSGQSVQPDLDIDPVELERQKRIRELREKNKPEEIKDYIVEHFQTEKPLEDLDLAAVTQIHDDIYIPF